VYASQTSLLTRIDADLFIGAGIVGESGAMNVFFLWQRKDGKKELVTPPLDGMVLPGVTRDTVRRPALSLFWLSLRFKSFAFENLSDDLFAC
jgi:branched-subunit amino acid aminotransferase/4-amino-4-deoxychorismate lyase